MRRASWCVVVLAVFSIALGCGQSSEDSSAEQKEEEAGVEAIAQSSGPTSEEVVQAFREEGLEVGASYPIEEDPGHAEFIGPKTYEEGTRFLLPSLGEDEGGQVYTYESREDLEVMKSYWEDLNEEGGMFFSWVFDKDNTLVHVSGRVPKKQAERYGEVMERL